MDGDMDAIREQKKREIQQKMVEQQQAEHQLEKTLRVILEPEAKERLSNVKIANAALYWKTAQTILMLYQQNPAGKLNEEHVKKILEKLSTKKEINIRRK